MLDLVAAPQLKKEVFRLLAEAPARVRSLTLPDGRRFWLKRIEALPLRMRLQKGDARRAFESERAGLRVLAKAGLPVAPIALDGPDFFVLPDVGRTLNRVLSDDAVPASEKARAFRAAGQSLARLHQADFVHGRPAIRDICWDGAEARFIDLERFSTSRRGTFHQALDVLMFVQTMMTATASPTPELDEALTAYQAAAPSDVMPMVRRIARRLGWFGPLIRLARHVRPRSRELNAATLTIAYLTDDVPPQS